MSFTTTNAVIDIVVESLVSTSVKTLQLEMHLDKLQLIATSMASNHIKVSWLVWWNSLTHTWIAQKFVDAPLWKEKLLA